MIEPGTRFELSLSTNLISQVFEHGDRGIVLGPDDTYGPGQAYHVRMDKTKEEHSFWFSAISPLSPLAALAECSE